MNVSEIKFKDITRHDTSIDKLFLVQRLSQIQTGSNDHCCILTTLSVIDHFGLYEVDTSPSYTGYFVVQCAIVFLENKNVCCCRYVSPFYEFIRIRVAFAHNSLKCVVLSHHILFHFPLHLSNHLLNLKSCGAQELHFLINFCIKLLEFFLEGLLNNRTLRLERRSQKTIFNRKRLLVQVNGFNLQLKYYRCNKPFYS